jgi:hypothetical protein
MSARAKPGQRWPALARVRFWPRSSHLCRWPDSVPLGRQTEREDTREAEALVKLQLQRADHEPMFEQPSGVPEDAEYYAPAVTTQELHTEPASTLGGLAATLRTQIEPELERDNGPEAGGCTKHSALSAAVDECPYPPVEIVEQLEHLECVAPHFQN